MNTATIKTDGAKILRTLYRVDDERLLAMHGLMPAKTSALADIASVQSGLAVAVNTAARRPRPGATVVLGGGCLGYTNTRLNDLRLDYLTDTMIALAVASMAGADCLIYLPIGEEQLTAPRQREQWSAFGDLVEAIVERLSATVAAPRSVTIARTDAAAVRSAIDRALIRHSDQLAASDLNTLYSLRPSGKPASPSPARLQQYRSTIMTYLPEVVSQLVGRHVDHILVAENLHQIKAVAVARALACGDGGHVDHLAHVPAPSLGGTVRMAVAKPESALMVTGSPTANAIMLRRASPMSLAYWQTVWDLHRQASPQPPAADLHTMLTVYRSLVLGERS